MQAVSAAARHRQCRSRFGYVVIVGSGWFGLWSFPLDSSARRFAGRITPALRGQKFQWTFVDVRTLRCCLLGRGEKYWEFRDLRQAIKFATATNGACCTILNAVVRPLESIRPGSRRIGQMNHPSHATSISGHLPGRPVSPLRDCRQAVMRPAQTASILSRPCAYSTSRCKRFSSRHRARPPPILRGGASPESPEVLDI